MKKIYISKTFDGYPECLVLAESEGLAKAFFQGKGLDMYSIEEIDLTNSFYDFNQDQVFQIIKTEKQTLSAFGENSREVLTICKR